MLGSHLSKLDKCLDKQLIGVMYYARLGKVAGEGPYPSGEDPYVMVAIRSTDLGWFENTII